MKLSDVTRLNYRTKGIILVGIDLFLLISSLSFFTPADFIAYALLPVAIAYPLVTVLLMMMGGSYRLSLRFFQWQSMVHIILNLAAASLVIGLIEHHMQLWQVSWINLISYMLLSSTLVLLSRFMLSVLLLNTDHKTQPTLNKQTKNIAIYGVNPLSEQLIESKSASDKIICLIDDDPSLHQRSVRGKHIFSRQGFFNTRQGQGAFFQPLLSLQIKQVNQLIIALTQFEPHQIDAIINQALENKLSVKILPHLSSINLQQDLWQQLENLSINSLLGRRAIKPNTKLMKQSVANQNILVTGAGGSIGSEICKQTIIYGAKSIVLLDHCEHHLYKIEQTLKRMVQQQALNVILESRLGSITDLTLLTQIFNDLPVDIVFHAAAYKHVPITQENPLQTFENNVWGTYQVLKVLQTYPHIHLVMISTDKAVEPANTMGISKRLAELMVQSLGVNHNYCVVRFGNVLGSSGSVIPLFQKQIKQGGPLTVTHPQMTRFFMTIEEATQLVIQSNALKNKRQIFVLDMGKPVSINDLAKRMIQLLGHHADDINIQYTGIRDGEKLHEKLHQKTLEKTEHPKIFQADDPVIIWKKLQPKLEQLFDHMKARETEKMLEFATNLLPENHPKKHEPQTPLEP